MDYINERGIRGNKTIGNQTKAVFSLRKIGSFKNELFFDCETTNQNTDQIDYTKNRISKNRQKSIGMDQGESHIFQKQYRRRQRFILVQNQSVSENTRTDGRPE